MSPAGCGIMEMPAHVFMRGLRTRDDGEPQIPLVASMELTSRCNLRCRHCFVRSSDSAGGEMTTGQVKQVMQKLADAGVMFLTLTGGEPLVRGDFRELYLHAKSLGLIPTLFSNGTMVTPDLAGFLAANPPRRVEITVYGHTEATYEAVTGVPGSFSSFREGVKALKDKGLLVSLKTMVMSINLDEFDLIKAWAAELDCDFRYDAVIHGRIDGGSGPAACRVPPGDVVKLHFAQSADRSEFESYQERVGPEPPAREYLLECGAGTLTLQVDSMGNAHPCILWRFDPYSLLTGSLDVEWLKHVKAIRERKMPDGRCRTCADHSACGYCSPLAILETGHPARPSPYFCKLAEERKRQIRELAKQPGEMVLE